jgi:hypothetical protein
MNKYLKHVLDFLGVDPSIDNTKEGIEQDVKVEDNIQEPVISFIKCFKANPKRFKIREVPNVLGGVIYPRYNNWEYMLTDNLTLEVFTFTVYFDRTIGCNGDVCENHYITSIKTNNESKLNLSYEEGELLWSELHTIASRKQAKDRYTRIAGARIEREIQAERDRLTNIYKQY